MDTLFTKLPEFLQHLIVWIWEIGNLIAAFLREHVPKGLSHLFTFGKLVVGTALSILNYLLFPNQFYYVSLSAVVIASCLDILTKRHAIAKKNGGHFQATKDEKLASNAFWEGSKKKFIQYLVIGVLAGLQHRLIDNDKIAFMLSVPIFSIMFSREVQSNLENLIEAGYDLHWLLDIAKQMEKLVYKIMEVRNKKYLKKVGSKDENPTPETSEKAEEEPQKEEESSDESIETDNGFTISTRYGEE